MAEFDDKLNALLSNPDSMAQIMQLAQSLSGSMGGAAAPDASPAPPPMSSPGPMANAPPEAAPPASGDAAPGIDFAAMMSSLLGGGQSAPPQGPPPPPSPMGGGGDLFSSLGGLLGGMDPKMLMRLLPLVQEFAQGQNTQAANLLYALRPFLKEERQDKVGRALQLARMIHIGKKFFAGWEV